MTLAGCPIPWFLPSTGRERFIIGSGTPFSLPVRPSLAKLSAKIKAAFPYTQYCVWESDIIMGVWLKPDPATIDRYVLPGKESIIVRHLISEAPLQTNSNTPTITIEKMLVDLFTGNEFEYLRGQELRRIFDNAWDRYSVNLN